MTHGIASTDVLIPISVPLIIGLWWLLAPNSVIRLYTHRWRQLGFGVSQPRPAFVRAAGVLWLLAVLMTLFR